MSKRITLSTPVGRDRNCTSPPYQITRSHNTLTGLLLIFARPAIPAGMASIPAVIASSARAPSLATAPTPASISGISTIVVPKKFSPKPGFAAGVCPGRVPNIHSPSISAGSAP
ncbi:hypothetical protein G1O98_26980 [Nostoc sp. UIC10630]|nr:hypothetical protein [Nostoc sp. UIC 10630]NEU82590.1 hypothetical protein [Nostoc sp. UIC 10630]